MFIISDLDGTLADINHRTWMIQNGNRDWDGFFRACVHDTPITPIIEVIKTLAAQPSNRVEIWSGRSDMVRAETQDWLHIVGLGDLPLRMRAERDHTPDDELKEQWMLGETNKPDLVFDDRDRVVAMWRRHDIYCAQIAPGNF